MSMHRQLLKQGSILGAALLLGMPAVVLRAQTGDTISARQLSRGVAYKHIVDKSGPWVMHLVRVDLRRAGVELRHARALDQLKGREKPSAMVRRASAGGAQVLAAMNADFFSLTTGENENNQVIGGEWWKGLKVTDSPYDTFDNTHIQFGVDGAGHPMIDRFMLDATAWAHGAATPILTVNFNPSGNPEGTALFTSRYGATTPRDTARVTAEAALIPIGRVGDTALYARRGPVSATSGSPIPTGGAVLSAYGNGSRLKEVQAMADGDTVRILLATQPRIRRGVTPSMLIGGWPRILRDGKEVASRAASLEGTISRNAEMRHPRTAIGFSRDSTTLYMLTVDGRSTTSVGMTLTELAGVMRRLGAWQAMNFDGGGSTTMVVDGAVMNAPSDATGEREVGNAVLLVRKP
ncbi:MAG: phosphodiester glycosidase family protein [bacterium]